MGKTNIKHKVSLRRIIGNVVDRLELTDVSSRISAMANWAVDAELKIGSRNSYEKFECEIEVNNYRACLPDNFVRMLAIKHGNDHLDVSMKDFRQWHKGAPVGVESKPESFNAGNKVKQAHPGVPQVIQIDFDGVFSSGDMINITVANDNCGALSTNIYNYTVQPGDNIPAIIAAFVSQINTTTGGPGAGLYHAVPDSSFLQLIANSPLILLTVTTWTNSNTGIVSHRTIQNKIQPVEAIEQTDPNCDVNINQTSENLAERTTYNLNDGIHSERPYTDGSGYTGGNGKSTLAVSKYAIENGYIHFGSIDKGKVGVAYYGIAVDEDGWPLIDPTHEDAVTTYLMYMLAWADLRKGKVSQGYFQTVENRWYWLCGQARGDDELPDEDEVQYHANAWNQLIPLPNHNYF
jgi:hypothetical protein